MSRQAGRAGQELHALPHSPLHSLPSPYCACTLPLPVAFRRRPSAPFPPPFPGGFIHHPPPVIRARRFSAAPPLRVRSSEQDWFLAETRTGEERWWWVLVRSASDLKLNLPADRIRSPSFSSAGKGPPAVLARWSDLRQLILAPWSKGEERSRSVPGRRPAEKPHP